MPVKTMLASRTPAILRLGYVQCKALSAMITMPAPLMVVILQLAALINPMELAMGKNLRHALCIRVILVLDNANRLPTPATMEICAQLIPALSQLAVLMPR